MNSLDDGKGVTMQIEFKVVGSSLAEVGVELRNMAASILGEDVDGGAPKGLAGFTDDELLEEVMNRGLSLVADEKPADRPKTKRTSKKAAAAAEEASDPVEAAEQAEEKSVSAEDKDDKMTPKEAYDKAIDAAVVLYSGPKKDEVMALLSHFDVKTFRDIDAEKDGLEFYEKVMAIQNGQA